MSDDLFEANDNDPFADGEEKPAVLADEVTGDDLEEDDDSEEKNGDAGDAAADAAADADADAAADAAAAAPVQMEDSTPQGPFEPSEFVPESDKFREWQESHNRFLDEKSQKEGAKREQEIEEARQWIDKFYAEREEKKSSRAKQNAEAEDDFVKERDTALTSGEPWERAAFFCDFQLQGEGSDASRMREIMIQLKH